MDARSSTQAHVVQHPPLHSHTVTAWSGEVLSNTSILSPVDSVTIAPLSHNSARTTPPRTTVGGMFDEDAARAKELGGAASAVEGGAWASEHSAAPVFIQPSAVLSDEPGTYTVHEDSGNHGGGGIADVMRAFTQRVRETSPLTLLWVLCLVAALMTGNAMIVICLNFWLQKFPSSPGRYTVFAVSGMVFSVFFLVALGLYVLVRRPDLSFLRHGFGWKLLIGIGSMDTLNSALAVYAAPQTAAVLQALFTALVPVYAAAFTKFLLQDPRSYCHSLVITSFTLIVLGVALASVFYLDIDGGGGSGADSSGSSAGGSSRASASRSAESCASSSTSSSSSLVQQSLLFLSSVRLSRSDTILWSLIFFVSVIPTVLMNVLQTIYMTRYTYEDSFTEEAQRILQDASARAARTSEGDSEVSEREGLLRGAERHTPTSASEPVEHSHHADDTSVKLVMLAAGTSVQSALTLLLMPMDALPWFGSSDSVPETWSNFQAGLACLWRCPNNFTFCVLYCSGFVLVYVAAAYLNQYSVTLCSMVSQLSAPITALVMVIFPRLNPSADVTPWYASMLSACILGLGTFLYVVWDEQTAEEKREGEILLKLRLLGHLPRDGDGDADNDGSSSRRARSVGGPVQQRVVVESTEGGP